MSPDASASASAQSATHAYSAYATTNTAGVESRQAAAARKKAALIVDEPDLKEAMDGPYREKRFEAMRDEVASLIENEVFGLCELPLGAVPLTGRWILKMKRGAQGVIERFKA